MHYRVLAELGKTRHGLSRKGLVEVLQIKDGQGFTSVFLGLEECGYIRRYVNPYRKGRKTTYQITNPFLMFSSRFIGSEQPLVDWLSYGDTASYNA